MNIALKIAKEIYMANKIAVEFNTEEEKKQYQKDHDVRPTTKLEVKQHNYQDAKNELSDKIKQKLNRDKEYLDLTKDPEKNKEQLQKMVDEQAKNNGYTHGPVYHGPATFGNDEKFNVYKNEAGGPWKPKRYSAFYGLSPAWHTDSEEQGREYGRNVQKNNIKMKKPLILEPDPYAQEEMIELAKKRDQLLKMNADENPFSKEYKELEKIRQQLKSRTEGSLAKYADSYYQLYDLAKEVNSPDELHNGVKIREALQKDGIDGIILVDTLADQDRAKGTPKNWYIPFEPEQIKSNAPITYDDQNNIIPLSERFNEQSSDARY